MQVGDGPAYLLGTTATIPATTQVNTLLSELIYPNWHAGEVSGAGEVLDVSPLIYNLAPWGVNVPYRRGVFEALCCPFPQATSEEFLCPDYFAIDAGTKCISILTGASLFQNMRPDGVTSSFVNPMQESFLIASATIPTVAAGVPIESHDNYINTNPFHALASLVYNRADVIMGRITDLREALLAIPPRPT